MKIDSPAKKTIAVMLSIVVIGAAGFAIYKYTHRPPDEGLQQHRALGRVLAEETVKSLEHRDKKRVLIIAAKASDAAMKVQLNTFLAVLKQHPEIEIKDKEPVLLEPDQKHRVGPGHGLSARRFVRLVEKNLKADAIVSFVGVPDPFDAEMKTLSTKVPRFLAATGDRDRVPELIANKMLRVAIVPRYEFPSPVKEPKTEQDWFDKYFQIIRAPKSTNSVTAGETK